MVYLSGQIQANQITESRRCAELRLRGCHTGNSRCMCVQLFSDLWNFLPFGRCTGRQGAGRQVVIFGRCFYSNTHISTEMKVIIMTVVAEFHPDVAIIKSNVSTLN